MFTSLAEKLQITLRKLRGKGKLCEADVDSALREIRLALLEADVNYKVVKSLTEAIRERSIGKEVMSSLTPGQQVVKIVNEEITTMLGQSHKGLSLSGKTPAVIMLVGLQGSGKTTTAVKIAAHQRKTGRNPLLVAADVYRPAAVEQIEVLAESSGEIVFSNSEGQPVDICKDAIKKAKKDGFDLVIIDTAGRLHIDKKMMSELEDIKMSCDPEEVLLVVDGMTGQDAVNAASSFNDIVALTGVVMTKLDGDTRGGAALSVYGVTGCPVKFIGTGEKVGALEEFYPDRMASRILGMGDILSLVEKAEASVDQAKAKELEMKLREQRFTLEDFKDQLVQLKKMGSMEEILNMLPGSGNIPKEVRDLSMKEDNFKRIEAIINSMTIGEKEDPDILNGSRRRRIATGSGTSVQDVNRLLKQFAQMQKMFKQFDQKSKKSKLKNFKRGKLEFPF